MISSVATLVALTQEAERALGGDGQVRITRFPFKIGRESRSRNSVSEWERERHVVGPTLNDVCLIEPPSAASLLHISREHFAIEYVDNKFFLVDCGSACGTIVAGKRIGGDRAGGRTELQHGDLVVVGTARSPYVFRFELKTSVPERARFIDAGQNTGAGL